MKQKLILLATITILLAGCSFNTAEAVTGAPGKKTKNIIFIIGDGMGVPHLYSGMSVAKEKLWMEMFPYVGLVKTFSADNYITDSAASGTAMASGVKTNNGMIGVTPDSTALESIIAVAHRNGLATGVVSTSSVTHATPASFVAHNSGRGNYEDIAKDFLNGTIDLFLGGGEDHFRKRADSADLTLDLKKQGFSVVYTLEDLKNDKSQKIAGLLAKEHLPQMLEGRGDMLPAMTAKAIEVWFLFDG
jgi:alkaline phosphatase